VPPPGEKVEHYAAGYAKIMCTAVFVTGLDPTFARENVGYFTAPYEARQALGTPKIDRQKRTVEVTMPNGIVQTAKQVASQGCITLPIGKTDVAFKPSIVKPNLPDPKTTPWPMGDLLPSGAPPAGVDMTKVQRAVDTAFDPAAMTAAFVVTYKGRIIAERYDNGATMTTPLESWSMGKSLSGTLFGLLVKQGVYTLDQPAPIPEWQTPGDPRQKIASVTFSTCRAACVSSRRRIPTTTRTALTRITSTTTRAPSMRSNMRRPGRSSGLPRPSGAIATPIQCSRTT
jgi:hypothetical protein